MELDAEATALLDAMSSPRFYDHDPQRVELRETHISWVFIADELAYKVKKPLRLPFVDYGTLDRRLAMCREEVRLNRRLAPDYYIGVRAIAEPDGPGRGYSLAEEGRTGAVEYAVEMRAIPEHRTLETLLGDGDLADGEIESVAERLARFHAGADRVENPAAATPRLIEALLENHRTLRLHAGEALADSRLLGAERFTDAFLRSGGRELLERRAAGGLVRDCHGDLRAEHVLVVEPVQVYDCVEFDPGLREIDVAADLAFLVMDVERLGAAEAGARLRSAYRETGLDLGSPRLLAFFAAYRAWVRAKVALFGPRAEAGSSEAAELHALGHRFAWRARRPFALAVCGPAASGKSTLAAALSKLSGLAIVDADGTRKRLAGLQPTERAAPEHYSAEFSRRTYRALGDSAARELQRTGAVIVDATARRRADRDALRAGLDRIEAPLLFARCRAPASVVVDRARRREADPERVSDAGVDVVERQLDEFEELAEVGATSRAVIDTTQTADDQITAVEALLDAATLGTAER